MDTRTHHDSAASNRQDNASLLSADDPVLQQFLTHFDPLARLEAEYAAVLAQSSSSSSNKPSPEDDNDGNNQKHGDDTNGENESDGDDADGEYARVPMSPASDDETEAGGGEYYQPLGDVSDSDDDGDLDDSGGESEAAPADGKGLEAQAAPAGKMDAAKRETIMKSMQGLQLAPPPWAKSANLSDDELFAMVRDLNK